jgi:hypothetical protein
MSMNDIRVPAIAEIATMSWNRCLSERTRLRNELSFARGNALWGGPSGDLEIAAYKKAIDAANERLAELTGEVNGPERAWRVDM